MPPELIKLGANITIADLEMAHVMMVLSKNKFHRKNTAKILGLSYLSLHRRLKKWKENGRVQVNRHPHDHATKELRSKQYIEFLHGREQHNG